MINSLEFNPNNKVKYDKMVIDLLSRYYPFTRQDLVDFKESLNFKYVVENEQIEWDKPLIDEVKEYIEWENTNFDGVIDVDYKFVKKYRNKFSILTLAIFSNRKNWDHKIIELFGDKIIGGGENKRFLNYIEIADIETIRKYQFKLDWIRISSSSELASDYTFVEEFEDYLDWKELSSNPYIQITEQFVNNYWEKLDYDSLCENPSALPYIIKNSELEIWNWEKVIKNPGITFDDENIEFYFKKFQSTFDENKYDYPKHLEYFAFVEYLLINPTNQIDYFIKDDVLKFINWEKFKEKLEFKLPMQLIEKYKSVINFKNYEFLDNHRDVLTYKFIVENIEKFDPKNFRFLNLKLSPEFFNFHSDKIHWGFVSGMENFEWSIDFLIKHFDKLSFGRPNKVIYDKLFKDKISHTDISKLLNSYKKIKNYYSSPTNDYSPMEINEDAELVINVWFVVDIATHVSYNWMAKAYNIQGSNVEKMEILKSLAETDYITAEREEYPSTWTFNDNGNEHAGKILFSSINRVFEQEFDYFVEVIESKLPDIVEFSGDLLTPNSTEPQFLPENPFFVLTFIMENEYGQMKPYTTEVNRQWYENEKHRIKNKGL